MYKQNFSENSPIDAVCCKATTQILGKTRYDKPLIVDLGEIMRKCKTFI